MKYVLLLAAAITITLSSQAVARLGNTEDKSMQFSGNQLTRVSQMATA